MSFQLAYWAAFFLLVIFTLTGLPPAREGAPRWRDALPDLLLLVLLGLIGWQVFGKALHQ